MNLEIVTIGDELLLGFTIDTNAAHLAREFAGLGVRIVRRATCGDDAESIRTAVQEALERTGAVITTGGLGPTADDMTKPAIASIFGKGMVMDDAILTNLREARGPAGGTILPHRHGCAPGIWLEDERGRWVIMLPGVPREMRGMLADTVLPTLRDRLPKDGPVIRSHTLRTANIAESALADRLGDLARGVNGLSLAYLPGSDGVDLRLTSWDKDARTATSALRDAAAQVRAKVEPFVYGEGDDDLAAIMLAECAARDATIAVAESCTGGMLGMRLTAIPGSSRTFLGGIIAYANEVKTRELGVPADIIAQHGAVSEPVARAMATGVRLRFGSTIGLGITGIAGPDGGTPDKPVGTVWVGVDIGGEVHAVRAVLPGDRHEIRWRAAQLALDRLRKAFRQERDAEGWTARG